METQRTSFDSRSTAPFYTGFLSAQPNKILFTFVKFILFFRDAQKAVV